jgi:hypothetical protein
MFSLFIFLKNIIVVYSGYTDETYIYINLISFEKKSNHEDFFLRLTVCVQAKLSKCLQLWGNEIHTHTFAVSSLV